jgi:thiol:disulfide interchange protein DsbD
MKRYLVPIIAILAVAISVSTVRADTLSALQTTFGKATPLLQTEPEVPDPDQVYRFTTDRADDGMIVLRVDIDHCCYLYREKLKLRLVTAAGQPATGARLGDIALPPGKVKIDEFVGKTEIYFKPFEIRVPIDQGSVKLSDLALRVDYQGCAEKPVAVCYAPMNKLIPLGSIAIGAATTDNGFSALWLALAAAFGAGLLLSFTPCVLPMVPILSGVIIGAEGKHATKLRAGLLSYIYVLGTALTYATAGAIAGATGEQLQAHFQNIWAIGFFSLILVLLALSMFGLYTLQVPAALQSLLHQHSSHLHKRAKKWVAGEYIGVFVLGLISALIIGACVSPVLVSVLGGAVAARDPILGASVMFALAHGQGVVLLAVGIGEGALLPKAGPWMDKVKYVFGVLLLAVAIYLLGFLPQVPVLLLWGTLFIVCAVYLGATQRLPEGAGGTRYLWKGFGTVLLIWGILAMIGGMSGQRDIFNPLPVSLFGGGTAQTTARSSLFERIRTIKDLDKAFVEARRAGKPILLDFYADWCVDCVRMEKGTFSDAVVRTELARRFVLVQVDVTDADDANVKALKKRFGVLGPPATLFFSSSGAEVRALRTYGYIERDAFLSMLRRID